MTHGRKFRHLGRDPVHRYAMIRNMAGSLIEHERLKTTLSRAKTLKPFVEKIITCGIKNTVESRRAAQSKLYSTAALKKVFDVLAKRYVNRPGGYTRIAKIGFRSPDGANIALIELVDREGEIRPPKPVTEQTLLRSKRGEKVFDVSKPKLQGLSALLSDSNDDNASSSLEEKKIVTQQTIRHKKRSSSKKN